MKLRRTPLPLGQETIDRMVDALRLGLYRIAPLPDGVSAVDLHHETHRLSCSVTRAPDGGTLPDVEMGAGTRRWTDTGSILASGDGFERREAFARRHAALATIVLRAPVVDEAEADRLKQALAALAVACNGPVTSGSAVIAEAPTSWSPLRVERIGVSGPDVAASPDEDLTDLFPQVASVRFDQLDGERPVVVFDTLKAFVSPASAPDPMSAMRTLAALRADAGHQTDGDAA